MYADSARQVLQLVLLYLNSRILLSNRAELLSDCTECTHKIISMIYTKVNSTYSELLNYKKNVVMTSHFYPVYITSYGLSYNM